MMPPKRNIHKIFRINTVILKLMFGLPDAYLMEKLKKRSRKKSESMSRLPLIGIAIIHGKNP